MQRCDNLVDLEKRCKMSIWTQKSALIQPRTSLLKFDDLAENFELSSVSNFSTKRGAECAVRRVPAAVEVLEVEMAPLAAGDDVADVSRLRRTEIALPDLKKFAVPRIPSLKVIFQSTCIDGRVQKHDRHSNLPQHCVTYKPSSHNQSVKYPIDYD